MPGSPHLVGPLFIVVAVSLGLIARMDAVALADTTASPLAQVPPTSITISVDRGPNASYTVGEPIVVCVQAQTAPAVPDYSPFVRITDIQAAGQSNTLYEGEVSGRRCFEAFVTPPLGREIIVAEYLVIGITGRPQVLNRAQVSFDVIPRVQPAPSPQPTASARPVGTATPSPSSTPTPTQTPPATPLATPTPTISSPEPFEVALIEAACGDDGFAHVSLAWSRSDAFDFYHVYRDGQEIWSEGPKSSLMYLDAWAPIGAEIGYEVVASNSIDTRPGTPSLLWVQTPSCDDLPPEPPADDGG